MAIRDRVTVTTRLGTVISLTATRAGGSVDHTRGRDWLTMTELGANGKTVLREAEVQVADIVSIMVDQEPVGKPVKRKGKSDAAQP